ncbi:MAG: DUF4167 domain-containing protein [Asticcacaulis sp.]|uniref:DUF4167 domain-containing protein n=1 Tax=Asticcacaulis sp. TaxID=1872648 RepID=UPI0039E3207B
MKRQRSRNRKPAGNSNNPNRAYESNGPEGTKVRGNAQTIYEKYQQLARDANSAGDRVLAENHLQHAEHYFRMIRQMQPTRPVSEFVQRDPFSSGFDDDYEEVEVEASETEAEASGDEQASDEPRYEARERNNDRDNRNNRDRDNRNNRDRDRMSGERNFKDRNNGERNNDQRSFEPRNNNQPRDNQGRDFGGDRNEPQFDENGNRRETRRERYERRRQQRFAEQEANMNASTPLPVAEPAYTSPAFIASTQPLGAAPRAPQPDLGFEAPAAEAPVKRERPPRKPRADASDDAAQLPAFMHRPTPVAAEPATAAAPEAEAKPKRTRKKKEDASASEEA